MCLKHCVRYKFFNLFSSVFAFNQLPYLQSIKALILIKLRKIKAIFFLRIFESHGVIRDFLFT